MIKDFVRERRWFRGKARRLASATIEETFPLELAGERTDLAIVRCMYEDGEAERYILPIARATGDAASSLRTERPHLVIGEDGGAVLYDALGSERHLAALLGHFARGGRRIATSKGTLVFRPLPGFDDAAAAANAPRVGQKEQTNTSVPFGDALILKVVRKLDEGRSAELEMGEFLTRSGYGSTPPVLGAIEIERANGAEPASVGLVHRYVANHGDAWAFTLDVLARDPAPAAFARHAATLGRRVGEMHVVLAAGTDPAFAPRPIPREERRALGDDVLTRAGAVRDHLRPSDLAGIAARVEAFVGLPVDPFAMRVHGDLHLGQILVSGDDFVIIDFEGEPARSLADRKGKRSPLADVAGMLRSFDYAAATVLRARSATDARAWYSGAARAFLTAYREVTSRSAREALSMPEPVWRSTLAFYLLEKCVYEIGYEANNRPDWIAIPRDGLARLLDDEGGAT